MTWWTVVLVAGGAFLFGVGLTRSLMQPQYCPRCGAYMKSRGREVADWLLRRKNHSSEGNGEGRD
jgi:hypothetical protein